MKQHILLEGTHFGTDGALFGNRDNQIILTNGELYPITAEQYSKPNCDITRAEALHIYNVVDKPSTVEVYA